MKHSALRIGYGHRSGSDVVNPTLDLQLTFGQTRFHGRVASQIFQLRQNVVLGDQPKLLILCRSSMVTQ